MLIRDAHLVSTWDRVEILPGVPAALERLHAAGFGLVVVSNQPVIARGLASPAQVDALHLRLGHALGGWIERFVYCPHHPNATDPAWRVRCECRKPRPGMLVRSAAELDLDLARSFLVGDRPSDIAAGRRAGCRAVLVESGEHRAREIESPDPVQADEAPHHRCADLPAAASWILEAS